MPFISPRLAVCKYSRNCADKFLFNENFSYSLSNPKDNPWRFLSPGTAAGPLIGGNLSVIASLMATAYEIDTAGKIVFLEDVGEEPYRVDRMLTQLKMAGKFDRCAGVVFGDFAGCDAAEIAEIAAGLDLHVPVLFNFAIGHCFPTASLPIGAMGRISSTENSFSITI